MDLNANIIEKVIDFIKNNQLFNQILKLIFMGVMMFFNILTLVYIYKVIVYQNINFSSISLMIYLILLMALSLFIIFKHWDYKYVSIYLVLIMLFF